MNEFRQAWVVVSVYGLSVSVDENVFTDKDEAERAATRARRAAWHPDVVVVSEVTIDLRAL